MITWSLKAGQARQPSVLGEQPPANDCLQRSVRSGSGVKRDRARTFDLHQRGVEAHLYLYPVVTREVTRRQITTGAAGQLPGRAPDGAVRPYPGVPVRRLQGGDPAHFDTLYSSAWLDLSGGPVVVSALDTGGRYYLLRLGRHRRRTGTRNFRTSDLTPGRRRNNPRPGPRCSPADRCRDASRRRARPRDRPAPCR